MKDTLDPKEFKMVSRKLTFVMVLQRIQLYIYSNVNESHQKDKYHTLS